MYYYAEMKLRGTPMEICGEFWWGSYSRGAAENVAGI